MSTPESLLKEAQHQLTSRFHYIIVGSGAGGGPLAARLALAGKRVLLIEAGSDPIKAKPSPAYPNAEVGEVTRIPAYYAAASEDGELSWMFSVRHYADTARQELDEKYNESPFDPNRPQGASTPIDPKYLDPHPNGGKQGVFYPRSSALGGCTAHHAMIVIRPNGKDWNYIAELTGDDSWRSDRMRGYFAKMERNLYIKAYDQFLRRLLGIFYYIWRWLVLLFDRRPTVGDGGHGFEGWQPTSFIDPYLVTTIKETDQPFFKAIVKAALAVLHSNYSFIALLKRALLRFRVVQHIDFNDVNTRRASPEGVFLIPIGTQGDKTDDADGLNPGRREGVREFLLSTVKRRPDKLVILTETHVTKVLFEKTVAGEPPRAIGVEAVNAPHLYEASPLQQPPPQKAAVRFFATTEVILCGGSFNTPQLLMISGIGDREHLAEHGIYSLFGADGKPLQQLATGNGKAAATVPVIHLPGVGRNMQDRYEVTVISELNKELSTLNDVSFTPGDGNDPARNTWLAGEKGLYATNGGTLAIIRRSAALQNDEPEPDLFTFAASATFRGYYWNWSRELFKRYLGGDEKNEHKFWSWVILKAYTQNNAGTVKLRTANPFDMPEICFHSFEETPGDGWQKDLAALVDAVRFVRNVNAKNPRQFIHEIQPGKDIADGSPEMEHWIKTQAWGHHACGTCRIGSDPWRADTQALIDNHAVLDSRFRVHGVKGLRIVDASVFPKIPGYFILAPIFMIAEKAADVLIADSIQPVSVTAATLPAEKEVAVEVTENVTQTIDPITSTEPVALPEPEMIEMQSEEPHDEEEQEEITALANAELILAMPQEEFRNIAHRTRKRLREKLDAMYSGNVVWRPKRKDSPVPRYRIWFLPRRWKKHLAAYQLVGGPRFAQPGNWGASYPQEAPLSLEGAKMITLTPGQFRYPCYEGSTDFYATPQTDSYTPSYLEAQPLAQSVGKSWEDGRYPPWIVTGSKKSPIEQYVEWFNGIWHTGDPSSWNREVFTNTATTIDPSGITRGADECAANFLTLFKFFPELRGEVVSWCANDREIFINWRFRIKNTRDRLPIGPITQVLSDQNAGRDFLVPVLDKFCFVEGHVSYRLAYFDIITLIGYLSDNYGGDELYDFLIQYLWQSVFTGGVALLPRMLINLFLGAFYWPPKPPEGLYAEPGDGFVRLKWDPVDGAEAYKVTRAMAISGNYVSPLPDRTDVILNSPTTSYIDENVTNGRPYWYLVSPIYKKWQPAAVHPDAPFYLPRDGRRRRRHQVT
jgi:choline dehydrogenase-like flavoprotein